MGDGVNISGISGAPFQAGNIAGRDITINYLVQGVARATPYSRTIRTFLELYLGTEARPAPFGGRDEQLEALDTWLLEDTRPYALVTAGAGQGKSALLVYWAHRVRERGTHHVVFVPVSLRLGFTAAEQVFAALAARLGEIYGEPVQSQSMSGAQWMDVALSFLDKEPPEKPLVVILDGLDEAVEWEVNESLFGTSVAAGVRVVVSARYTHRTPTATRWLEKLGWYHKNAFVLLVPKLSRTVLPLILISMSNPLGNLAGRDDILDELYRLSEGGDALLIGLYIEMLRQKEENVLIVSINEIRQMEPGLAGLYTRWLQEQRIQWRDNKLAERTVRVVLTVLAATFGPIDRETLLTVIPKDYDVDPFTLDTALATLNRWIVKNETGYGFNHPRLAHFFLEDKDYGIPWHDRQVWNNRFVQAGYQLLEALQTHQVSPTIFNTPDHSPCYLLEHYAKHLGYASNWYEPVAITYYYKIVCQEWAQAWEARHGTYDGFIEDLEKVRLVAKNDSNVRQGLKIQLWCAMCKSSIVALSSNIPADILAGATKISLLSKKQVAALLRYTSDPKQFVDTIERLLEIFPEDHDFRLNLFDLVCALEDPNQQAKALAFFIPWHKVSVWRSAQTLKYEWARAQVLVALAPHLPFEVYDTAQAMINEAYRAKVLAALAPYLPTQVYESSLTLKEEGPRVLSFTSLAAYLPFKVYETAQMFTEERVYAHFLVALAPYLPLEVYRAYNLSNEFYRAQVLCALAPYMPLDVYQVAQELIYDNARSEVFVALVPYIPIKVLQTASTLLEERNRTPVLVALASHLPHDVYPFVQTLEREEYRAEVLAALAPTFQ